MVKYITAILLLSVTTASAQQTTPVAIDRIAGALGQCVATAEKQSDQLIDLQKQLTAAQTRIKELEVTK